VALCMLLQEIASRKLPGVGRQGGNRMKVLCMYVAGRLGAVLGGPASRGWPSRTVLHNTYLDKVPGTHLHSTVHTVRKAARLDTKTTNEIISPQICDRERWCNSSTRAGNRR
jgi:hypothetical protein